MNSNCKPSLKFCLILIFVFFTSHASMAQNIAKADIKQVIENYIVGWRTGDADKLNKAFDLDVGIILWIDKKGNSEKLKSMKLSDLVDNTRPSEGYGVNYKIQNLDIVNSQIAMAKVRIPLSSGSYYIDYLQLQKIGKKWRIVVKSYVYFPKR